LLGWKSSFLPPYHPDSLSQTKTFLPLNGMGLHWCKNPRLFGMCSISSNLKPCPVPKNYLKFYRSKKGYSNNLKGFS